MVNKIFQMPIVSSEMRLILLWAAINLLTRYTFNI